MLKFPLPEQGFFPQVVLTAQEVEYYEKLGARQANELVRIAEDTKTTEMWHDRTTRSGASIQVARYQDVRARPKHMHADENPVLIKSSVIVRDTTAHEVFHAVTKMQTAEYRKAMRYLHGQMFLDGMTLFKFPSARQGDWHHRAIKWCAVKFNNVSLDFAFLEYTGKPTLTNKTEPNSTAIGYCMQEGIAWNREVPTLEAFKISRCCLPRTGVIISRTHCPSTVRVTSICLLDGESETISRSLLAPAMQELVGAIQRLPGLIERERVDRMPLLRDWELIPKNRGRTCAVCERGFFLHCKYNCRACGHVICSSCASTHLRQEKRGKLVEVRICKVCLQTNTDDFCGPRSRASEAAGSDHSDEHGMWVATPERAQVRQSSPQAWRDGIQRSRPRQKELVEMLLKIAEEIHSIRDAIETAAEEEGVPSYFQNNAQAFEDFFDTVCRIKHNVDRASPTKHQRDSIFPGEEEEKVSSVTRMALEIVRATQDASKAFLNARQADPHAMSVEAAGRGLQRTALNLSYMTATEPDENEQDSVHSGSYPHNQMNYSIHTPPPVSSGNNRYSQSPPIAGLAVGSHEDLRDAPVAVPSINWAISLPSTSSAASHNSSDMMLSPPAVDTRAPHSAPADLSTADTRTHAPLTLKDLEELKRDDSLSFGAFPRPIMLSDASGFSLASLPAASDSSLPIPMPAMQMPRGMPMPMPGPHNVQVMPTAPSFPSSSTRSSLVGTRPPAPTPPVAKIVYMNELGVEEPYWEQDKPDECTL